MQEERGKKNNRVFNNYRGKYRNPNNKKETVNNFLPPLALFESYEEMSPGITQKVIELAKVEQKHRHDLEKQHIQTDMYVAQIGQFFAFILSAAALWLTYIFAIYYDNSLLALIVFIGWFGFLTMVEISNYNKINKRSSKSRDSV